MLAPPFFRAPSMQINFGLRSVLAFQWPYRLCLASSREARRTKEWFMKNVVDLRDGQKIVDVGCGSIFPLVSTNIVAGVNRVRMSASSAKAANWLL